MLLGKIVAAISDPLNGTNFTTHPWNTTMSPFVNLLGTWFYLIPVSFIGAALFVKTRDPVMLSMYMITSGALLSTGSIFTGVMDMAVAYILFTAAGLTGLILSLIFRR